MGIWPVACIVLAVALMLADLTLPGFANFWVGHALTAGFVSSGLFLLITILFVDRVIKRREEARTATIAGQLAAMLLRQAKRVLTDARKDLRLLVKAREEEERVTEAAREESEEPNEEVDQDANTHATGARADTLRVAVAAAMAAAAGVAAAGMGFIAPASAIIAGVGSPLLQLALERMRIRSQLAATVWGRTKEFEAALASAVPFFAASDPGKECIEAGFAFVERLHDAALKSDFKQAHQWLTGDQVIGALNRFESAVKEVGSA